MVLVAYAIAVSSVLFQTITHNRILTPAIKGFYALYILIQAIIVFAFGMNGIADWSPAWKFLFEVALMTTFASFNSIRTELFLVSALTVAAASVIGWRLRRIYDVVALGRYPHIPGLATRTYYTKDAERTLRSGCDHTHHQRSAHLRALHVTDRWEGGGRARISHFDGDGQGYDA